MSKREWKLFVDDILESIGLIEDYVGNMELNDFKEDKKTIDAVVRNLEIIGEASKNIPQGVRNKHTEIDWIGLLGIRNRIAHEYFSISLTRVWDIIKKELPKLKEQMKQILK